MQIIYEPHPVTPERKAELRAQGYKILDAAFAPEELMAAVKEDKPKRGRPAKAVTDAAVN
jgi:hypothetical protein